MRRTLWLPLIVAAGVVVLTLGACTGSGAWTTAFMVEPDELAFTGRNPYFILEPGYSLVLEGGNARLTITVLNEVPRAASWSRSPGTTSRSASGPTTSSTSAKTSTCTKTAGS